MILAQRILPAVGRLLPATSILLATATLAFAGGNVLDVGPSGAYPTVQAAVDAAVDGDLVVVQTGTYPAFLIANKSVTVVAESGSQVSISGGSRIRDLAPGRVVVLSGLNLHGSPLSNQAVASAGLYIDANLGSVRVEACHLFGGSGPSGAGTGAGAHVNACPDVAFVGCTLKGGHNPGYCLSAPDGSSGLDVDGGSNVTLYGSTLTGADGRDGGCNCDGGQGGQGASIHQSTLFASKCSFRGGRGGNTSPSTQLNYTIAGDGGNGIWAEQATVRTQGSTATPGIPGTLYGGCGFYGFEGTAGVPWFGSVYIDVVGTGRYLASGTLVHAGATETVTVRGQAGDVVGLFLTPRTGPALFVPNWNGVALVPLRPAPAVQELLLLGVIPANGRLEYTLQIPSLTPGDPSRTTYLQALFLDTQGQRFLSGGRSLSVIP